MSKQLLIYDNIQPIATKHAKWSVEVTNYAYVDGLNSVPLLATEIPFAAPEYPIVFSSTGNEGEYIPLAVMGLKDGQNLLLTSDKLMSTRYVPGFIRRYPFILGGSKDSDLMTLCLDEDSALFSPDGSKGVRLFEDNGEQSTYLKDVVEFLKDYQVRAEMTRAFTKRLHELDLLEPMTANITFKNSESSNLNVTGFYVVKREKLKALGDEAVLELFKRDGLELIYSHLYSLANFNQLIDLMSKELVSK